MDIMEGVFRLAFANFWLKTLIFSTYVLQLNQSKKGGHIMAYKISDECISCGACADECPVSAIAEGDGKFEISADACIECGACADVCPVNAPAAE